MSTKIAQAVAANQSRHLQTYVVAQGQCIDCPLLAQI